MNRTATPFLIVTLHRPMYIDSNYGGVPTGDWDVMNLLQANVEPLTQAAKVTLMLYGHNHRFEAISAAYRNQTVTRSAPAEFRGEPVALYAAPRATVHFVAGTAGASFTKNDCVSTGGPCPEWSERVVYEHGFLRLEAVNATALYFEYVATVNNTVLDRRLIVQDLDQPWAAGA